MEKNIICQGRSISSSELCWLSDIVNDHPDWSRHKITTHICTQWDWRTHKGQLKTFAARSFIDKLEVRGLLKLPPIRKNLRRPPRPLYPDNFHFPQKHPIEGILDRYTPLTVQIPISNSYEEHCFGFYLKNHHYLGFNKSVGESLKYLVQDHRGRNIACLLFGSAAWKTAPRDNFIGWNAKVRERNINFLTNNSRFLILPWVRIPCLASHILGLITRRIQKDWMERYAHPIHMVETFVEIPRFKGTCYKAANWIQVGETKGRSRQDPDRTLSVPIKTIWLYPLTRKFKQILCDEK